MLYTAIVLKTLKTAASYFCFLELPCDGLQKNIYRACTFIIETASKVHEHASRLLWPTIQTCHVEMGQLSENLGWGKRAKYLTHV